MRARIFLREICTFLESQPSKHKAEQILEEMNNFIINNYNCEILIVGQFFVLFLVIYAGS